MSSENILEKFKEIMKSWTCPKCGKEVEWKWSMCQKCNTGKPIKKKEDATPNLDSKK